MASAPSPLTPVSTGSFSNLRRPPRKSTLTQQQRNQKRQRATQDQLITLEQEFNKNPTPSALVRERIAQEINMTERSVQIWFQNRRAKIKNIAKKSIESGEDCNEIPESMRRYLAMQAIESGKPLGRDFMSRCSNGNSYFNGSMMLNGESSSKVVIQHFSCRSLTIGTWRRIGLTAMDLVIFYSPEKACITYYIHNDSAGYKIEYPFSHIKSITLETGEAVSNAEGASQGSGGLVVELSRPPNFFMDDSGSGGFFQCGDFSEDQQASRVLIHHLGGHPKVLSGQLAKLVSLDSFQSRHLCFPPPGAVAQSAPVSPVHHRPASQPNHVVHPHINVTHEAAFGSPNQLGAGMGGPAGMGLQPPRGHKRQRSRSVPIAVDVNMLRNPMNPFVMQAQAHHVTQPEIYAPIPNHHNHPNPFAPGSQLSIDTSSGYGIDFRQYPMSATTSNSPSEFGTPAFFTSSSTTTDNASVTSLAPPYSATFLSPMSADPGAIPYNPSVSPMTALSPGDPIIANQSPPLVGLDRSGSVELFRMAHEHGGPLDEGIALSDMYTKPMALPFRPPVQDDQPRVMNTGHGSEHLDMHSFMNFGTIDPNSLRHEHHSMWTQEKIEC